MSFTRSGLFAFVLATAAVGCRNDNRSDNLEPPAPATKAVENPEVDTTVTQPAGTAEPGGGATMSGSVDRNDTSDTSGVTGGGTLGSDTVNQNANTAPGDAGVTDQNRAARRGTGPAPSAQTPPVDDQTSPSDQTSPTDQTSPSDQTSPATSDTATGTGTTNTGTNTENAGTGGGAGTTQPPR